MWQFAILSGLTHFYGKRENVRINVQINVRIGKSKNADYFDLSGNKLLIKLIHGIYIILQAICF